MMYQSRRILDTNFGRTHKAEILRVMVKNNRSIQGGQAMAKVSGNTHT